MGAVQNRQEDGGLSGGGSEDVEQERVDDGRRGRSIPGVPQRSVRCTSFNALSDLISDIVAL